MNNHWQPQESTQLEHSKKQKDNDERPRRKSTTGIKIDMSFDIGVTIHMHSDAHLYCSLLYLCFILFSALLMIYTVLCSTYDLYCSLLYLCFILFSALLMIYTVLYCSLLTSDLFTCFVLPHRFLQEPYVSRKKVYKEKGECSKVRFSYYQ